MFEGSGQRSNKKHKKFEFDLIIKKYSDVYLLKEGKSSLNYLPLFYGEDVSLELFSNIQQESIKVHSYMSQHHCEVDGMVIEWIQNSEGQLVLHDIVSLTLNDQFALKFKPTWRR